MIRVKRTQIWCCLYVLTVVFAAALAVMSDLRAGERSEPTEPAEYDYAAQDRACKNGRLGFYLTRKGNLYFYDKNGNKLEDQFLTVESTERSYTYYFGKNGRGYKGFLTKGNKVYYFFDSGVMAESELVILDGREYYFGEDGSLEP